MSQILPLRGLLVQHHLIISDDGVDLIDGGFFRGIARIQKALHQHGKTLSDIRSIFLTHGHLDHTLNVAKLQKLTACRVYAPRADRDHVLGCHKYRGRGKILGALEAIGRLLFRFKAPEVDHWFEPGETIHGLEVIALPGHTTGHCGFLQRDTKLLFAGDLFTNHFGKPSPPPDLLNDERTEALKSIMNASEMDLAGLFLNHSWKMPPMLALQALRTLSRSICGTLG